MFSFPFFSRRSSGAADIPPGTYATPSDVADAISQLIGGAPDVTLDTIAEIAARIINDESTLAAISASIANKQDKNLKLTALSALTLAANKLIYATGENTLATTDLTAFMRTVLAAADAAAARAAIGALGTGDGGVFGRNIFALGVSPLGSIPIATDGAGATGVVTTSAFSRALLALANPTAGAIVYTTNSAGSISTITTSGFTRNMLGIANPAAGAMVYATDGNGNVGTTISGRLGRGILSLDAPALGSIPISTDAAGTAGFITTGSGGRGLLAIDAPAAGSIPYFTSAAGATGSIVSSSFGRTWLTHAGAQQARGVLGMLQVSYYRITSVALVPGASVELTFTNTFTEAGFDNPQLGLLAGRVTGSNASYRDLELEGLIVVDGAADITVDWVATDNSGNVYAPTGAAAATAAIPSMTNVRATKAGKIVVPGPKGFELTSGTAYSQLRCYLSIPSNATAVNVTAAMVRIKQVA